MSQPDHRPTPPTGSRSVRTGTSMLGLIVGIAALTAHASETELVQGIQRYCTVCWRNARLDPGVWDDCTQEVCYRLVAKARSGDLDLGRVFAEESEERRELVRAIDMVRKRVQRARRVLPLDGPESTPTDVDRREREREELAEVLERARQAVLSPRQDRIVELWTRGWTVPQIAETLDMSAARVSDEKYKAIRKLERYLVNAPEGESLDPTRFTA